MWVQYKHQATGRSSVARSTKQKAVISALCFLFLCAALSWLRCRPSPPRHYVSLFLSIFFPRRSLLRRPSSAASSLLCFLHLYRTGSTISFMLYYRTSSKKNPHLARCIAQWRHSLWYVVRLRLFINARSLIQMTDEDEQQEVFASQEPLWCASKAPALHMRHGGQFGIYIDNVCVVLGAIHHPALHLPKANIFWRQGKCR